MASFAFPISRLVDPVLVALVVVAAGLWLSRRRRVAGAPRGPGAGIGERLEQGDRAAGGEHKVFLPAPPPPWVPLRVRIGRAAAWGGWIMLWLLATPAVASGLARCVGERPRDLTADLAGSAPESRAMVVLSAGMTPAEHGAPAMERLSDAALHRCIGAARIYQTYGFGRVILSGRDPELDPAELVGGMADLMAALGVPREKILLETEAIDTRENAIFSARMARDLAATRVVVVTSALHMPRAVRWFERAGLQVIPAPVRFDPPPPTGLQALLPSATALARSQRVMHEVIGRLEP